MEDQPHAPVGTTFAWAVFCQSRHIRNKRFPTVAPDLTQGKINCFLITCLRVCIQCSTLTYDKQTNPHFHSGFCSTCFWRFFLHPDKEYHNVTVRGSNGRFMSSWTLRPKFYTGSFHTSRWVYMRTSKYNTADSPWLRLSAVILHLAKAGKSPALSLTVILPNMMFVGPCIIVITEE